MANTLLTPAMITNEAARILSNELHFAGRVNSQYNDSFAKSGAKIGDTISIRKPAKFTVRSGPVVDIQNFTETSQPLVVNKQFGVDVNFSSQETTLSLDMVSERFIRPAATALANKIDSELFTLTKQVYNAVGTPGVALTGGPSGTSLTAVLNSGVKLDQNLAPRGSDRSLLIDPAFQATLASNGLNLFNPSGNISGQYDTGEITTALGYKIFMDQNSPTHTVGVYGGTPLTNGVNQTGSSLITDGWTPTTTTLEVGDVFTIGDVYSVNPQSKVSTNTLQQFVVTEKTVTDGAGNSTIKISPSIITSGTEQNVSGPAVDGKAITVLGASGVTGQSSLSLHRDAFVTAFVDLEVPGGVDTAARTSDPESGISIRYVRQYDVVSDRWIGRLDVLFGYSVLYPQLACRIFSS